MALTVNRTLWRILKRTGSSSSMNSLVADGRKRHFWRKSGREKEGEAEEEEVKQKASEQDKKVPLQERQREMMARGLPKKRPIPGKVG